MTDPDITARLETIRALISDKCNEFIGRRLDSIALDEVKVAVTNILVQLDMKTSRDGLPNITDLVDTVVTVDPMDKNNLLVFFNRKRE